jgi:phosphodiesterase/alkaline phosphatase D-like protein
VPLATHSIASGDVTSSSAIVWTHTNQESQMSAQFSIDPNFDTAESVGSANATADNDFTV